jgi:hypothetical protein
LLTPDRIGDRVHQARAQPVAVHLRHVHRLAGTLGLGQRVVVDRADLDRCVLPARQRAPDHHVLQDVGVGLREGLLGGEFDALGGGSGGQLLRLQSGGFSGQRLERATAHHRVRYPADHPGGPTDRRSTDWNHRADGGPCHCGGDSLDENLGRASGEALGEVEDATLALGQLCKAGSGVELGLLGPDLCPLLARPLLHALGPERASARLHRAQHATLGAQPL